MRVKSFLVLYLFSIFWTNCVFGETNLNVTNQKSTLRPTVERVFSRKKRWMIFPKGANLKFTLNVSKRLLAMYPKGFNFNLEAAVYYPMPSARIDLIPKRFRKPTTKAPAPTGTTPLYLIGIPGSLIKYRAKPATKPAKVQRIDENVANLKWISSPSYNGYYNKTLQSKWSNKLSSQKWLSSPSSNLYYNNSQPYKWSKYNSPAYLKNYQWSPEKQQKYVNRYSNGNNKWNRWSRPTRPTYSSANAKWNSRPRYGRDIDEAVALTENFEDTSDYEPIYFEDLEPFEDHPHYHSYRGRRELFHHFEGLSKM